MNKIKKVLSAWMLVACVLPVAAQYPVIPDSAKERGAKQEAEFEQKSNAAWEKALPTVLEEAQKGRPYKPWASKPEDLIKSNIPAFPGAEGGGMYTPGGRGGKVIVVTSLEDSGPGTFREACETGGARTIVFNVSGIIHLKSPISVRAPYVTIAGQTAPGDGICITGNSFLIDTHDVVIRHMRFRRGAQDVAFRDDAVGGNAVGNIIVDHCSASWGLDENMSIYRHVYNRDESGHGLKLPTVNITIQNSVFPDSAKERGAKQEAEFEQKSNAAWEKALPTVLEEAQKGRPYKPWASKPEDLIKSNIPAFPGAEGGGMYTPGGRGGKVIVVTSLEDSGPGTFREACETGGARTIVFNVSGIIHLKSPISVRAPYVTIAGQTAPGDGICITGNSFLIDTHDVVIRHMRFRRGAQDVAFRDDAVGGNAVGNIIVDHCSASWGLDENMSIYRHVYNRDESGHGLKLPTVNITIQNSVFSEALNTYNHAFGATIGGHNSMFCRNLFASNISRNSSVGMDGDFNFVNNVVFNWWNRSVDGGDHNSLYNMINNYFKPGPITPLGKPISYRILKPEAGRDKSRPLSFGKAYVNGNIIHGNAQVTKDNWDGGVQLANEVDAEKFLPQIRVDEPFKMSPVTIMDTQKAYNFVLDNVGATFPKRDAVDTRVIKTVRTGKAIYVKDAPEFVSPYVKRRLPADSYKQGIITDIRQVGGLPEYKGEAYLDSDGDGMPDAWEIANGLNPNDPTDAVKDCNGDGYTNIEKYINGIDTKKKVDWTDLKNNYDTLSKRKSLF